VQQITKSFVHFPRIGVSSRSPSVLFSSFIEFWLDSFSVVNPSVDLLLSSPFPPWCWTTSRDPILPLTTSGPRANFEVVDRIFFFKPTVVLINFYFSSPRLAFQSGLLPCHPFCQAQFQANFDLLYYRRGSAAVAAAGKILFLYACHRFVNAIPFPHAMLVTSRGDGVRNCQVVIESFLFQ